MEWVKLHATVETDRVRLNQACSMLKDGKCSDYENRPKACRDYPVGCESCIKSVNMFAEDKEKVLEAINGR
jgi:Fe-S-cluster containining protein